MNRRSPPMGRWGSRVLGRQTGTSHGQMGHRLPVFSRQQVKPGMPFGEVRPLRNGAVQHLFNTASVRGPERKAPVQRLLTVSHPCPRRLCLLLALVWGSDRLSNLPKLAWQGNGITGIRGLAVRRRVHSLNHQVSLPLCWQRGSHILFLQHPSSPVLSTHFTAHGTTLATMLQRASMPASSHPRPAGQRLLFRGILHGPT